MNGKRGDVDVLTRRVRQGVESVLSLPSDSGGRGAPVVEEFSSRLEHLLDRRVPIPAKVGRFALSRVLGFGGMGVVMEGNHVTTGQKVAVKLAMRSKPQFAEVLRQEARALGRVDALNVVRVLDSGQTDDYIWVGNEPYRGKHSCRAIPATGA